MNQRIERRIDRVPQTLAPPTFTNHDRMAEVVEATIRERHRAKLAKNGEDTH